MAKIEVEVERLDRIRLTVFELIQKFQEPWQRRRNPSFRSLEKEEDSAGLQRKNPKPEKAHLFK